MGADRFGRGGSEFLAANPVDGEKSKHEVVGVFYLKLQRLHFQMEPRNLLALPAPAAAALRRSSSTSASLEWPPPQPPPPCGVSAVSGGGWRSGVGAGAAVPVSLWCSAAKLASDDASETTAAGDRPAMWNGSVSLAADAATAAAAAAAADAGTGDGTGEGEGDDDSESVVLRGLERPAASAFGSSWMRPCVNEAPPVSKNAKFQTCATTFARFSFIS